MPNIGKDDAMNDYEEKKQARIERYRRKAEKARGESVGLSQQVDEMLSAIPPGQPIHGVSDRHYRERMNKKMGQSVSAAEKAEYYEYKAEAAEKNTAISSDDPDAIIKLRDKLVGLKWAQEEMKRINAYYRKHKTCQGCEGVSDEEAARLDHEVETGYSWETAPYPSYKLSNNNQEIHRIEDRLKTLEQTRDGKFQGWEFEGGKVVANVEANRLQIFFDEVPSEELRSKLKHGAFKWARSVGAWQRQLTQNAIYAAKHIPEIRPKDGSDPIKLQGKAKNKDAQERG